MRMVESRSCVQREGVYRWFSSLTSAQRAEFLCGLLDLCVPIELRFLGSCLEDLARKDYHSLRDAEIKANNSADLSGLTNITDEVVRSKLLVSLALLGSDNREAAGVLYRTLTHTDTVINNYGLTLNEGRTEEQFLLLFTMASNHPAFSFHQKQVLRQQLGQIQDTLQSQMREGSTTSGSGATAVRGDQETVGPELSPPLPELPPPAPPPPPPPPPPPLPPPPHLPMSLSVGKGLEAAAVPPKSHQGKTVKAVIERVGLRGATHCSEDTTEFMFEVNWSDGGAVSVVRTQQEVTELLSQLLKTFPDEGLEKFLPQTTELDPRCLTSLSPLVLQHHSVQRFFTSTTPLSPKCPPSLSSSLPSLASLPSSPPTAPVTPTCPLNSSLGLGCTVQYRGSNRAVYRVASVQPVVSTQRSILTRSAPHLSTLRPPPPLPPSIPPSQHSTQLPTLTPSLPSLSSQGSMAGGGDVPSQQQHQLSHQHSYSQNKLHSQHLHHHHPTNSQSSSQPLSHHLSHSQSHSLSRSQPPPQPQPTTPEQNDILDWLRKLRLHKYYPVFEQLTMEEFLALTEEDLNKYDLTQGAKKKLKTQLELQNREMRSCSGIARVIPSSHMERLSTSHPTSTAGELRVEVDTAPHHRLVSADISSSSGYSSSSCSPRSLLCCDSSFDRSRDLHRRISGPDPAGGALEKERSCLFILNSSGPTGSSRPTAQVLPVQTDPLPPPLPPTCSSHLPFGFPHSPYPPPPATFTHSLLPPASNPARILTSPRKPRPHPLCSEDRTKALGSGLPVGPAAAPPAGHSPGFSPGAGVQMGVRVENLFPPLMDGSPTVAEASVCRGLAGGLMVETSSALTSTSNSVHHVSHPPVHFHLSSSSSPSLSGHYSYPLSSSFSSSSSYVSTKSSSQSGVSGGGFVSMSNAHSVPVAAVPGNTYHPPLPTSSPSPSPCAASSLDQNSGHTASMCVCSSCGCRGNCGAYGALPGYAAAGYLQPLSAGPSIFTLGPLLHLSPLLASSGTAGSPSTPFSYPMMMPPPLYRHSPLSHDQQQGFGFYQPHGMMGNGAQKRAAGSMSCYNCGAGGHRAEDCKQPPMDSVQQGTFRLKYTPHSDTKDSGD